jgi:hypothetical protein
LLKNPEMFSKEEKEPQGLELRLFQDSEEVSTLSRPSGQNVIANR